MGFGLPAVVLLGLDRAWPALWRIPPAFDRLRGWLGIADFGPADHRELAIACLVGVGIGAVAALLATAWQAWRGRGPGTLFGDARALIPSDPRDYGMAALVALSAGLTEEAFFRLLLPLLTAQAMGSAALGFVGATLLFGWAHRYQGWRGVVATTVAGAAMALAYLSTASLPLVMALHAAGDLIHLVARPALRRWIEQRKSSPERGGGPSRSDGGRAPSQVRDRAPPPRR